MNTFLKVLFSKPVLIFVACVLLLFVGHSRGVAVTEAKHRAAEAAVALKAANQKAGRAEVTTDVITAHVDRVKVIRVRGATIIKEVPVYVPSDTCALPGGFRVLHDAAAGGELPDPASIADAPAVGVIALAETVAGNYATCHENAAQLIALQEWAAAMSAEP